MRRPILTGESLVVTACALLLAIMFWPMQSTAGPPEDAASPKAALTTTATEA
ncbi:MAG: hypothetical protein QNJ98_07410 [Planctomycetota bacterium]|nr:hypothetical protein [Planctomycetota bacterium]